MAKRTRQQEVKDYIQPVVVFGYKNGFWQSLIFHSIVLTILSFIFNVEISVKPIAIELSFSTSEVLDDELVIQSIPSLESLQDAEDSDAVENGEPQSSEIVQVSASSVSPESFTPPVPENISEIAYTKTIEPSDLYKQITTNSQDSSDDFQETTEDPSAIVGKLAQSINKANTDKNGNGSGGNVLEQRLKAYGAKTGDVQISLAWNNIDDIDLHVQFTPGNGLVDNINWVNRVGRMSNGMLDIDMNAHSTTTSTTPVENVFWPPGSSPQGVFTVYVHFFRSWSGKTNIPVIVRIKNGDNIQTLTVNAQLYSNPQLVKQFSYPPNQKFKF